MWRLDQMYDPFEKIGPGRPIFVPDQIFHDRTTRSQYSGEDSHAQNKRVVYWRSLLTGFATWIYTGHSQETVQPWAQHVLVPAFQ